MVRRLLAAVLSLLIATPVHAGWLDVPVSSTLGTANTWTALQTFSNGLTVSGGQVLVPNGTIGVPSISFSAQTNLGIYRAGTNTLSIALAGQDIASFTDGTFTLGNLSANQVVLRVDAANALAQRNGTNAQSFAVYNTFTDASNYERFRAYWSGNVLNLATEAAGTGTVRNIALMGGRVGIGIVPTATLHAYHPTDNVAFNLETGGANTLANINLGGSTGGSAFGVLRYDTAVTSLIVKNNYAADGTYGKIQFYQNLGGATEVFSLVAGQARMYNTAGYALSGANGQSLAIQRLTELTAVGSGISTKATTIQIPADAVVWAVPVRVKTQPGGTSTMTVTATTSGTVFQKGASISTAAGTTDPGNKNAPVNYNSVAAQTITFTFDAPTTDALGEIRVDIYYYIPTAPTS